MTSSYWFQGGPAPGPDVGDPIGQSLRFRTGQQLKNDNLTLGNGQWTISLWTKITLENQSESRKAILATGSSAGSTVVGYIAHYNYLAPDAYANNFSLVHYSNSGASTGFPTSNMKFSDPTAWNHFVFQNDGTSGCKVFVNGVLDPQFDNQSSGFALNGDSIQIGGSTVYPNYNYDGYIAEVYNIDGQLLEPTAFGRYNREGVWVPVKPDFAMTSGGEKYSSYLTVSNGAQYGDSSLAFNGDLDPTGSGSGRVFTDVGATLTWAPEPAVPFTTSLEIYNTNAAGQNEATWDGNTAPANGGWITVYTGSGEVSADKPLVIQGLSGRAEIHAVRIDGELVNDPYMWSSNVTLVGSGSEGGFVTGPEFIFDGSTGTICEANASNQSIKWVPGTPITFNDKVEVWSDVTAGQNTIWYNTGEPDAKSTGSAGPGNWTVAEEGGGVLKDLRVYGQGSASRWAAVRIDGEIYVDGTNPSYGPNGFHLDFSDPNDIGADRSGNGHNFTATGFDTFVGTVETDLWRESFRDYNAAVNFDNYLGKTPYSPSTELSISTSEMLLFEMEQEVTSIDVVWNRGLSGIQAGGTTWAVSLDGSAGSWTTVISNQGVSGVVPISNGGSPFRFIRAGAATSWGWGTGVLQPSDTVSINYDLMLDSPTQNYATFNSVNVDKEAGIDTKPVLSNANLQATFDSSNTSCSAYSTIQFRLDDTNTYYFEMHALDATSTTYPALYFNRNSIDGPNTAGNVYFYQQVNGVIVYGNGRPNGSGTTWATGDVVGVTVDPSNDQVTIQVNGDSNTVDLQSNPDDEYIVASVNITLNRIGSINFGQQPFFYTPPAGTVALQTQNLPKPTIVDGGEHFRVLIGDGASILSAAQGQLNGDNGAGFQRALWWIKDRDNTGNHQLMDSVRGGDLIINSDNTSAETNYSTPSGPCVAWCWKAGDTVETNNDGSIESQVSANVKGGFSIVSYSGTGAAGATIGHGLGKRPDFVIIKNRNNAGNSHRVWASGHFGAGANYSLYLDMTSGWTVDSDSIQDVDDSTITLPSDALATNRSGNDYICYAWTNVPGYSAIGSYKGNGIVDGPVINCGFKPAYIMTKRTDDTSNWFILDAARNTYNPLYQWLEANEAAQEQNNQVPAYTVDFLSNGFKIRGTGDVLNVSNGDYLYIAFAQHPFGGSKIAPATAGFVGPVQYDTALPGIASSLRFRGAQQLRSADYSGTTTSGTFSFWLKIAADDTEQMFIHGMQSGAANGAGDLMRRALTTYNNRFDMASDAGTTLNSIGAYRDPGAWYHITYNFSPSGPQYWFNGVRDDDGVTTAMSIVENPSQLNKIVIGNNGGGSSPNYLKGYLADFHYVDGQALPPTEFGQYVDGTWRPKDVDISDYGTNGFHLIFDPAYVVGDTLRDQSGNANDFTMMGFELGDFYSTSFDLMKDGPTENYATMNPLYNNGDTGPGTLSDGNLGYTAYTAPGYKVCPGTQSIKGGAYYWEYYPGNVSNSYPAQVGILRGTNPALTTRIGWDTNNNVFGFSLQYNGQLTGDANGEGSSTEEVIDNIATGFGDGDVIGMYCDIPNNYVGWYKNGVLHCEVTNVNSEYEWMPALSQFYDNPSNFVNFGQQPFRYPLPAGYQALQTANLPEAPIPNGRDHFTPVLFPYTQQTISGLDFAPDLVWLKVRNNSWNHRLYDTIRGPLERLESNNTDQENGGGTDSDGVNSFTSDGFTHLGLGASGSDEYVAWCWKAGGAAVSNNDGSIASQVSANTDAGFSIITWTGTGSDGSYGHGLDQAPEFIIHKRRDSTSDWHVYHEGIGGSPTHDLLYLNLADAANTGNNNVFRQDPDSSVIYAGTAGSHNVAGGTYVDYAWHSVPGYSAFGSYQSNGSDDGSFIYLGFRPAFVMVKNITTIGTNWIIQDSTRSPNNPAALALLPNEPRDEDANSTTSMDLLSNGFKLRGQNNDTNQSGQTYVYAAFAENPINISNAR